MNPFPAPLALSDMRSAVKVRRRALLLGALSVGAGAGLLACREGGAPAPRAPMMAPATLAARIDDVKSGKIAVFYVGPRALFGRGRVPGAKALAEVDSEEGLEKLRSAIKSTTEGTEIVVYCGCCPVRNCPNVRPAGEAVSALGRKNVFVLDLPTRFSTDWADKGYPVERS